MKACLFAGQGTQFRGMGQALFPKYSELTSLASDILGYSISDLCLNDPHQNLAKTQYTQPAIFVVNALSYLAFQEENPVPFDYFAGHSLGEYNALAAANVFSFEEGLRLVQLRGQLMAQASGGGMLVVLGATFTEVADMLQRHALSDVQFANFNTPTQLVLSGPERDIAAAEDALTANSVRCVLLNVGGAFHSRLMNHARDAFLADLVTRTLNPSSPAVVANRTGRPYVVAQATQTLAEQIASPVLWQDSMNYLLDQGVEHFHEMGDGRILTKMLTEIRSHRESAKQFA